MIHSRLERLQWSAPRGGRKINFRINFVFVAWHFDFASCSLRRASKLKFSLPTVRPGVTERRKKLFGNDETSPKRKQTALIQIDSLRSAIIYCLWFLASREFESVCSGSPRELVPMASSQIEINVKAKFSENDSSEIWISKSMAGRRLPMTENHRRPTDVSSASTSPPNLPSFE